ncbi:hypothetical protein DEAC_c17300 [Desulfosporosinus acididurans]|uniref:HD domain-containing protein n=1 Tax=Desulfosporosinus acididurans TaxID=476652 RepID=A0A0J1INT3_9FIRM|nr:hypothetical protein [Desulfosporosinus acididurans]KLU66331.1 hypothetical protein DEAC_c17300 [Desulfosporosinus acididurans]
MIDLDHKEVILSLLGFVNRPGIDRFINFLNESDFFQAPCSTKHHLAKPGGLAEHSLHVYNLLYEKINRFGLEVPRDTITICGLGHDLCKVNYYQEGGDPCSDAQYNYLSNLWTQKQSFFEESSKEKLASLLDEKNLFARSIPSAKATIIIDWLKNKPNNPLPELPVVFSVADKLPLGHGEKSVSILQDFIKLTDNEKLAIRWHMGAWDLSDYSGRWSFNNANKLTPLVALLTTADFEASNILEKEGE